MSPLILLGSVFRISVLAGGSANLLHVLSVILAHVHLKATWPRGYIFLASSWLGPQIDRAFSIRYTLQVQLLVLIRHYC